MSSMPDGSAATPTRVRLIPRTALTRTDRVLEAIIALGKMAAPDRGLELYLERAAEAICDALDYHVCVIYLYDRFDDAYYTEATRGVDIDLRQDLLARPVPSRVVERLMVDHYRLDRSYYIPATDPIWSDSEVRACVVMPSRPAPIRQGAWQPGDVFLTPMETDGKAPIGYILVDEPSDGRLPGLETVRGLIALATSCATAVESVRLYGLQHEEASISTVLLQVSKAAGTPDQELLFQRTSAILADLLGADHCMVWHIDDETVDLRPVAAADRAGNALALEAVEDVGHDLRTILARGEPVVVEQAASGSVDAEGGAAALAERLGLTSALFIPLFLHDVFVGAITVGWTGVPHRFRVRELDIARGASRLVGVALQNARLYRDVTRQAERNAQLYEREREAVVRLQELDELRSDFVTTISHELRTPLTGIKGFTETLLSYWERMEDTRRLEMVRRINTSSNRLERLVQDLLFIARIESGGLPLRATIADLQPLIEGAMQEVEGKFRGQEIQLRPPATHLSVLADPDRIQQVLVNLFDNAAKYSPEGRPIRVRWSARERKACIQVVDRGPGIERADYARLFTRFGKLDRTPRAGHGGTGLGLYICKSLVEAMGGTITVRSRPRWGSIFTITLPLSSQ